MNSKIEAAKKLAKFAHRGQTTKAGHNYYWHHIVPVMQIADERNGWSASIMRAEDVLVAAILHDTIEDTFVTKEYLEEYFGSFVAEVVDAVSRREVKMLDGTELSRESYADFIERIASMEGSIGDVAREVKIADLIHHLQDTSAISDSLVERYTKAAIRLGFVK